MIYKTEVGKSIEKDLFNSCDKCRNWGINKMIKLNSDKFTLKSTISERHNCRKVCFQCAKQLIKQKKYKDHFLEEIFKNGF